MKKKTLTKAEVAKIINTLINSVPEENSITIETFQIAKRTVLKYDGRYFKQHSGKVWTEKKDEKLCKMFEERCCITEICDVLGRTERGCAARLRRLGKIERRSEIYEYLEY